MSATHPNGRLLTADDLAVRWTVTKNTIYAWCRSGELPVVPLPGRTIRFRLDAIEEYEKRPSNPSTEGSR